MPREERASYTPVFSDQTDFNEQLYLQLRKAPYWMIAIAFHLLLIVISSLFGSEPAAVAGGQEMAVGMVTDPLPEEEKPEEEEAEQIQPDEVVSKEPVVKDAEISDHNETDVDMPFEESFGEDGISDAPFSGPANNGLIGIGGSAGGAFKGRGGSRNLRTGAGGGKKTQDAVDHALRWLKAHQSPDGGWECESFYRWCEGKPAVGSGPEGRGKATYDVGVTGLALLAFLGAGYTNRSEGEFGKVVNEGLKYLRRVQDAEGCFGNRSFQQFVYNHAIAALAMVEAYGMTGSAIYKNPAQKGLDFIAICRNPYQVWRYGVKPGENDLSVTGWMMMALKSAKLINSADIKAGKSPSLQFDEEAFEGIRNWVDKMTDEMGRAGYQQKGSGPARTPEMVEKFPQDKSESMTAVAMLARIFLGEDPRSSDMIKKGAELCAKLPPRWEDDGSIDIYYWYYATLAMFQVGGSAWDKWNKAMESGIVNSQRLDTDYCMYKGSWDTKDPWSPEGGRVYTTAAMALCLEVYFRYEKVFGAN